MKHIYHSHTMYCKHSSYSVNQLVEKAIEEGYETIGISEHAPFKNGPYKWAMDYWSDFENYVKDVTIAKEKYQDKIRVLCGLEIDIITRVTGEVAIDWIKKLINYPGIDFAIYSLHFYKEDNVNHIPLTIQRLAEAKAAYNKLFAEIDVKYIAHPDVYMNGNKVFDANAKALANFIVDLAIKHDVTLGFNVNGRAEGKLYPCLEFWKIVQEKGARAYMEIDAHHPFHFEKKWQEELQQFASSIDLKLVEKIW